VVRALAIGHGEERLDEALGIGRLGHERVGTGEGGEDREQVVGEGRVEHAPWARAETVESQAQAQPVLARHVKVDQREIRGPAPGEGQRGLCVGRGADDVEVGLRGDECDQPRADGVIVDDEQRGHVDAGCRESASITIVAVPYTELAA